MSGAAISRSRGFLELRIAQACSGINEQGEATRELHRDSPEVLERLEAHAEHVVLTQDPRRAE